MRHTFTKILSAMVLCVVMLMAALPAAASDITGVIVDSDGEPLASATVRLLKAQADSAFVAGTSADLDGAYRLGDISAGRYVLEATYVGFAPTKVPVTIDKQAVVVDTIVMTQPTNLLKEVSVVGVKTPIKVSNDTIEFNADTYLTRPNAVVEDLLKRLPGVEVGSDGSISVNGKSVSKILVDGKEFFSDDPKVASKNLPAEMVDKLQVVDRKSDLARLTGVDDGEEETVINLSVKKGMKNGWFGTVEAGYGTDERYAANFNVSRFQDNTQFTLLGNFNNINELGFTDSNGNRFRRFGGNNGITTSNSLGLNFTAGKSDKFRVGGDVLYSNTSTRSTTRSEKQYLFPDSVSYASSNKRARDRGHNLRGDFRLQWQPDSFNLLDFRPNFSINFNRSTSLDSTMTRAGDAMRTPVNSTVNDALSRGTSVELGGRLIYTHNFSNHRGRSFSFMGNYRLSNVREKSTALNRNVFYLFNDSTDIYDQYTNAHTWSNSAMGRLSWTEPLGDPTRGNYLTLSYGITYRWNNTDKLVYDIERLSAVESDTVQVYNPELSNRFRNNFMSQDIRVGYKKVTSKINSEVGISLVPSMSSSTNLTNSDKTIPTRHVFNIAPFARFRYAMSRQRSMAINYRGRSSEPSMTQLQPVADLSDPLRIVQGNPDLDPSFTHHLMLRFQDFNADAQRSIMAMADFDLVQNSIVRHTTYNSETGGQFTTYENVNGVWNGRVMCMLSMPLRNKKFIFSNHAFVMADRAVGFNNALRNATTTVRINEAPALSFRPDNLQLELRPFYNLQVTHSSLPTVMGTTVHNYGVRFDGTYYTPFGLSLSTDLNYNASRGYADGYDNNLWMWNASVSYSFLRGQNATVTLKAYDLLGQTKNISRTVTANYIEDLDYSSLTRYFMVTFNYKFNTFGKGKQPASSDFTRQGRGMGGPPPGARGERPSGPPPGM